MSRRGDGRVLRTTKGENAKRIEGAHKAAHGPAGTFGPVAATFSPEIVRAHIERGLCPWCGRGPYKVIAMHVSKVHGIGRKELRDMAGLLTSSVICAPEISEQRSAIMQRLGAPPAFLAARPGKGRVFTQAGRESQRERGKKAPHPRQERGLCVVCGGPIPTTARRPTIKTCSDECRRDRRVEASKEIRAREKRTR